MSLASLHPMLYEGRCAVELSSVEHSFASRAAALTLTGHYRTQLLEVSIRPPGMAGPPTGARVSLQGLEGFFASGTDGAITELPAHDGIHVVRFTAYYTHRRLHAMILRARLPDVRESVLVGLDGLPEFFTWCSRASSIFYRGGRMCGFDAADLAALCGIVEHRHHATSLRYNAGGFVEGDDVDVFAEEDPVLDAEIMRMHRRVAGVQ